MIFLLCCIPLIFALVAAVWIWDRRDLAREYQRMETMSPEEAYRHEIVLKYLPQSASDMQLLDEAIARGDPL